MDILALLLYIILAIILITLVIVIGWLYYDYVELKDNLNSNFSYVRRKFNDHDEKDEDLEEDIDDNYKDINNVPGIKEDIKDIKAILGNSASEDGETRATGFYKVKDTVGVFGTRPDGSEATGLIQANLANLDMKKKFHHNLNSYFEFGTVNEGLNEPWTGGQAGDFIGNMWFREFDNEDNNDKKLKLIQDTTIAANMTVNTDTDSSPNKHLKICNNKDGNAKVCYKLYVDDNGDLNIQSGLGGKADSKLIMGESTVLLPTGADTSSTRKSLRDQPHKHKYDKYDVSGDIVSTTSTPTDTDIAVYT